MTSVPRKIRDAIYDRLKTWPTFKLVRKTYVPQVQPDQLPVLSIIILNERLTPDGDGNTGEPHYLVESTIGISALRGFDDPRVLDDSFEDDLDDIENQLLTDASFITFNKVDALFESISSISRKRHFPQQAEAYFSELRLEMVFQSRWTYEPIITDDFKTLDIKTTPLGHSQAPIIEIKISEDQ